MNTDMHHRPTARAAIALTIAALLSAGAVGCSGGDDDSFKSWVDKGGKEHTLAMGTDIRSLVQLSGQGGGSEAVARCRQILDHVASARAYRKLPDETGQRSWAKVLDETERTATNCAQNKETGLTGGPKLSEAAEAQSAYSALSISLAQLSKTAS
ncbi:hypothetical protein ACIRBX_23940 [Kitasatospora sp. NPDC096147]|uniref:hypothetical protein n=1 Tax=Kitasatospora sp. NPDC096147 TaxID=3364093 RepID=UPI003822C632